MEERLNLVETLAEFKESKNIDRETLMRLLEDIFRSVLTKKFGSDANFDVIVNVDRGDVEIQRYREIVEDSDVENDATQISLTDAIKIQPDFEVGEEVMEEIHLADFQRREILSLRQSLISKIMEYEKDQIFKKYEGRVGELVSGEVSQAWRKEIIVTDSEGIDLILPKTEQIQGEHGDRFKKGDVVVAVVERVEIISSTPRITISRTSPRLLERLMEEECPEIKQGLIIIRNVVRSPGERAKVLVESYDERVDPVGACVGMKGARIHGITRELRGESIDVINYTDNAKLLIQRALSPAKITRIELDEETKTASVFMMPDQVSKAIGKGGYNIKLAGRLSGYEIDVFRDDDDEDIYLQEFSDVFEQYIIDAFKSIGCDTARNLLRVSRDELIDRTDLEEETVDRVISEVKNELGIK